MDCGVIIERKVIWMVKGEKLIMDQQTQIDVSLLLKNNYSRKTKAMAFRLW